MRMRGPVISSVLLMILSGCVTGPFGYFMHDGNDCGPKPGSAEWWNQQAAAPPGARQKCYKGKSWPVQPRPTGPKQQFTHAFHSAHYWPLPYVCQDRAYVRDIIHTQVRNGWVEETTLYHRHFEGDQSLTVPGELHLLDILEVTPLQHRTVYVQATRNHDLDNARLANVRQMIVELTGGEESVPVELRRGREYSRPASEVKIINDLYSGSVPTPRLGGTAGGGGGGGGAGAGVPATGP